MLCFRPNNFLLYCKLNSNFEWRNFPDFIIKQISNSLENVDYPNVKIINDAGDAWI